MQLCPIFLLNFFLKPFNDEVVQFFDDLTSTGNTLNLVLLSLIRSYSAKIQHLGHCICCISWNRQVKNIIKNDDLRTSTATLFKKIPLPLKRQLIAQLLIVNRGVVLLPLFFQIFTPFERQPLQLHERAIEHIEHANVFRKIPSADISRESRK